MAAFDPTCAFEDTNHCADEPPVQLGVVELHLFSAQRANGPVGGKGGRGLIEPVLFWHDASPLITGGSAIELSVTGAWVQPLSVMR
jgi:hypothetical protein